MEENRINEIEAYAKRREEESIQKELAEKNEKEILLAKICNEWNRPLSWFCNI